MPSPSIIFFNKRAFEQFTSLQIVNNICVNERQTNETIDQGEVTLRNRIITMPWFHLAPLDILDLIRHTDCKAFSLT